MEREKRNGTKSWVERKGKGKGSDRRKEVRRRSSVGTLIVETSVEGRVEVGNEKREKKGRNVTKVE